MVASSSRSATVSRTTSAVDFTANAFNPTETRRTRKRISAAQLAQLEELYRRSSHPTRDQRSALAKLIEMETKSVTIWFQNKRQTDRKVALHNATNSRNLMASYPAARAPPDITLTAPTSPSHPAHQSEAVARRSSSDGIPRRQFSTRPAPLKRAASLTSSVTSMSTASTTSTSKTRVSLDRIASRTEIRFSHRHSLMRGGNSGVSLVKTGNSTSLARNNRANTPPRLSRSASRTSQAPPTSPPPAASSLLWENMLSSPLAPSSPPPPEYIAYARARKARTLEWACAAARLSASEPVLPSIPKPTPSASLAESAISLTKAQGGAVSEREYDEAMSVTEDEAELITPHGSQDASVPWSKFPNKSSAQLFEPPRDAMDIVQGIVDATNVPIATRGWEADEMHAALALCGLRG